MNGDDALATADDQMRTRLANFNTSRAPKYAPQISYLHIGKHESEDLLSA